jgi:hypothetical protein
MDGSADQRGRDTMALPPSAVATWSSLLEASGDSESADLPASSIDDDGDAESCSGGDHGSEQELDVVGTRLVSWECWMMESAASVMVVGAWPGDARTPKATGSSGRIALLMDTSE